MAFFSSISEDGTVLDILKLHPQAGKALIQYHQAVLDQKSDLSAGEREMIAAYVSGLNACRYCHGVHTATAEAHGVPEGLLADLMDDIDGAQVDDKLKPMLKYARKLTLEPAKMVRADADAVFAAGWDERALHDAICVISLFNLMNRLVDGHGVKGHAELYRQRGARLRDAGYGGLINLLEAAPDGQ